MDTSRRPQVRRPAGELTPSFRVRFKHSFGLLLESFLSFAGVGLRGCCVRSTGTHYVSALTGALAPTALAFGIRVPIPTCGALGENSRLPPGGVRLKEWMKRSLEVAGLVHLDICAGAMPDIRGSKAVPHLYAFWQPSIGIVKACTFRVEPLP